MGQLPVAPKSVGPEVVVRLQYGLYDAEGELVEAPGPEEALEFLFGVGQAPAELERAIDGLRIGQSRRVKLPARHGFGVRDEAALIEVDASELPVGASPGDEFEAERADGQVVFLRVVELAEGVARLDSNHPLAGQTVTLELTVLAIRAATSEELRAAELALAEADAGEVPHVLASRLLRRDRSAPSGSA
jgi:FKBP-type peptidyl-prolyl cis-trans isomerase SlyD